VEEVRTFSTMTGDLLALSDWLAGHGVSRRASGPAYSGSWLKATCWFRDSAPRLAFLPFGDEIGKTARNNRGLFDLGVRPTLHISAGSDGSDPGIPLWRSFRSIPVIDPRKFPRGGPACGTETGQDFPVRAGSPVSE